MAELNTLNMNIVQGVIIAMLVGGFGSTISICVMMWRKLILITIEVHSMHHATAEALANGNKGLYIKTYKEKKVELMENYRFTRVTR